MILGGSGSKLIRKIVTTNFENQRDQSYCVKDLLGLYVQNSNHFSLLIFISIEITSISDGRFSSFNNFEVMLFLKYTKTPST